MMNYDDMRNIMRAVELENYFIKVDAEVDKALVTNENFMNITDAILEIENRCRNIEDAKAMRRRCDKLTNLIKVMNNIEMEAIKIKDHDLMWKCEARKGKMIMQMQLMQDKYDF